MNSLQNAYIALGSNQGDRFKFLQEAINYIYQEIGVVSKISRVYSCAASGFDGPDFLNAAVVVKTRMSPHQVLKKLLKIEKWLGRERRSSDKYTSRTIDLDLILFEDQVIQTKTLILPHPRMNQRNFVLQPLSDLNMNLMHPLINKNIGQLKMSCDDENVLNAQNVWLKNPSKQFDFSSYNYLTIEGNIGAGKTSLATMISEDYNAKLILERFADNPFLPKFYKEPNRYAFTLEMSFLADRYQQISDDLAQLNLFKDFVVSDYDVHKSLIFSKITLAREEFNLYRRLFYQVYRDMPKPDFYVYLYQNTARLQENIKRRGRAFEQKIENKYLEDINTGYLEFLKSSAALNVKIIDISDMDFVKSRSDYLTLIDQILG